MKVHPSALKHGVAAEDAIQAAEWALWIEPLDPGPPSREVRLGLDALAKSQTINTADEEGQDQPILQASTA